MGIENNPQTNINKTSGMKFRKIVVVAVVVIVVVAVVAGGYLALNSGKPGSPFSPGGNSAISSASSLQYTVSVTNSTGGLVGAWTYYAKNIGTSNLCLRIEYAAASTNFIYIVNGVQHTVWVSENNFWVDESSLYATQLDTWNNAFKGYVNFLANYAGTSDYTYHSSNGQTIRYTNIAVNPNLSDSFFTH